MIRTRTAFHIAAPTGRGRVANNNRNNASLPRAGD
jgi:hypothetical protein